MKNKEILIFILTGYTAINLLTIGENINKLSYTSNPLEGLDASAQILKALLLCGLVYFLCKRNLQEAKPESKENVSSPQSPLMNRYFIGEREKVYKMQQSTSSLISQSFISRFSVSTRVPANTPNDEKGVPKITIAGESLDSTPPHIIRIHELSNEGVIDPIFLPPATEQNTENFPSYSLRDNGFSMFKKEEEIQPGSVTFNPFVA